ncbi:MAG: MFS transporter [Planctomycetes bacterium]|nr:MFS transporter [Planctomycetota bacterium]
MLTSFADHCAARFGAGLSARGLLFFGLGLAALCGALFAGIASDRAGKRRSVLAALLGTAALAPLLLVPRGFPAFLGIALAVSFVQALRPGPFVAILTELAEPRLRGSLVGLNGLSAGLGLAAGTWLSGVVFARLGLAGGVLIALAAVLLAALLFGLLVPGRKGAAPAARLEAGGGTMQHDARVRSRA